MRRLVWVGLLAVFAIGATALTFCRRTSEIGRKERASATGLDEFDGHRALAELAEIVTMGNRYYGAPERDRALEAIVRRLVPVVSRVDTQRIPAPHPGGRGRITLVNVIARQHVERRRRLVLATHWDTRLWAEEDPDPARREEPIPGANDGTSGVAVLLEMARVLARAPLQSLGVDYVLFDGEEYGRPGSDDHCRGSRFFARHVSEVYPAEPPEAAIVLDMVGDGDLEIKKEPISMQGAGWLLRLVWAVGQERGEEAFRDDEMISIYDDHVPLLEVGIPAILLIDFDYPYWHTHGDTVERCSAESLARVGNVVLASVRRLDQAAGRHIGSHIPPLGHGREAR